MRVGSGNFWQFMRKWGNSNSAGGATDAASARTALGLGTLATANSVATAQIDNDAVTYAKIQNVTASRLLGNPTGGAADLSEISLGALLAFSGASLVGALQIFILQDQRANGVAGGNTVASTWTKVTCDDQIVNTISGASQASSVFTLPAGKYLFFTVKSFYNVTTGFVTRIRNTTDSTTVSLSLSHAFDGRNFPVINVGYTDIAGNKDFELQYFAGGVVSNGLGNPFAPGTELEIYSLVAIVKIG